MNLVDIFIDSAVMSKSVNPVMPGVLNDGAEKNSGS
jgi:hypothetical protein